MLYAIPSSSLDSFSCSGMKTQYNPELVVPMLQNIASLAFFLTEPKKWIFMMRFESSRRRHEESFFDSF